MSHHITQWPSDMGGLLGSFVYAACTVIVLKISKKNEWLLVWKVRSIC